MLRGTSFVRVIYRPDEAGFVVSRFAKLDVEADEVDDGHERQPSPTPLCTSTLATTVVVVLVRMGDIVSNDEGWLAVGHRVSIVNRRTDPRESHRVSGHRGRHAGIPGEDGEPDRNVPEGDRER